MDNSRIRIHIPAIPYTITRSEYSHDAYTGKVLRLSPMMRSRGFEVYHYGVETSESGATKNFDLMTKDEWIELRIQTIVFVEKFAGRTISYEDAKKKNSDQGMVIGGLANWSSPLTKEFNKRLRQKLIENYRGKSTDIICMPLGQTHQGAVENLDFVTVESGIGYSHSYLNYRIFESHAWMSSTLGIEKKAPNNYWFVIPNYFDTNEFKLTVTPVPKRIGFLGRIAGFKGCSIIVEIARRFPDVEFIICGQGDPSQFVVCPNIIYKKPIHGAERSEYLGSCVAVLCLSKFLEPFCGTAVEAQLCGTPVISTDWGGMAETIEQGKSGLRGHTLSDFCQGVTMALDGKFDRIYIRERAVKLFDMYNLAYNYEYAFKNILDIHTPGKNGWYSPDTHIAPLVEHIQEILPISSPIPLLMNQPINNSLIRLHVPAITYTITRSEYSHDAFTNKVRQFSPMMRSRGFEVYHYGVETSESGATKNFDLMTKDEWTELRIQTLQYIDPALTREAAEKKNADPGMLVNVLSNWGSPLTKEFNKRFRQKLTENYRSKSTDIVCLPLGRTYQDSLDKLDYAVIEMGIGYEGSYMNFRIFEAYSFMSNNLGIANVQPNNYWFVIPHAFNVDEFKLSLNPKMNPPRVGFMGRITNLKGCSIIVEIAKRFPHIEFVICGQGNPAPFLTVPNVLYKPPIHGSERSDFLGTCIAFLHPAKYLEPFGCGPVEAQLCGTPVICSDWGGMAETVEQCKTGLRCHTLADFCYGIQMALDGKFNRSYIRQRAENLYNMYNLAYNYEYVFKSILDIHTPGKNGWYSPDTHIVPLLNNITTDSMDNTTYMVVKPIIKQRIYIFIVYYGALPNYFQLFLDSLGINTDILSVFLVTDIDLTGYTVPKNLIHIQLTKQNVKERISNILFKTYGKHVATDDLVTTNYKFVDFKIIYPILFDDYLQKYKVTKDDYVGWGDCDLIYGKMSRFIDFNEGYGIFGGWHGHFVAIKNTDSFKNNFTNIPNYFELVTDNSKTFITDEIAYREPLIKYISHNKLKMFYTNANFCDIVPPCFYHMSRPDHATYSRNFYDLYKSKVNINYLYYDKVASNLSILYDTGEKRDVLYCHLQKRKMELPFTSYDKGYYINEQSFSLVQEKESIIPLKIWQTWKTHELPPKMKENVDRLKENHPEFEYKLFDDEDCRVFIKEHFPEEVLLAYDALIPGAYKADLWRYCVLYIHGGIYLDVKIQLVDGLTFHSFVDKEYVVRDGKIVKNGIEYASIYNGLMICKKKNPSLLNTIVNVVYNVSTKFMGDNPWESTGPRLLGTNCNILVTAADFIYNNSQGKDTIRDTNGKIISVHYPEYREEQKSALQVGYYINLWNNKTIYNDCNIDLLKIYNKRLWPNEFHESIGGLVNR
jgi:glycosyltransferase involved in cell wall biosynthesis